MIEIVKTIFCKSHKYVGQSHKRFLRYAKKTHIIELKTQQGFNKPNNSFKKNILFRRNSIFRQIEEFAREINLLNKRGVESVL